MFRPLVLIYSLTLFSAKCLFDHCKNIHYLIITRLVKRGEGVMKKK